MNTLKLTKAPPFWQKTPQMLLEPQLTNLQFCGGPGNGSMVQPDRLTAHTAPPTVPPRPTAATEGLSPSQLGKYSKSAVYPKTLQTLVYPPKQKGYKRGLVDEESSVFFMCPFTEGKKSYKTTTQRSASTLSFQITLFP